MRIKAMVSIDDDKVEMVDLNIIDDKDQIRDFILEQISSKKDSFSDYSFHHVPLMYDENCEIIVHCFKKKGSHTFDTINVDAIVHKDFYIDIIQPDFQVESWPLVKEFIYQRVLGFYKECRSAPPEKVEKMRLVYPSSQVIQYEIIVSSFPLLSINNN